MAHILPELFSEATRTHINDAPTEHAVERCQGQPTGHNQILEAEIRTLKYRHNAASGSCRLPPKILSSIFLVVLDTATTSRATDHFKHLWDVYNGGSVSWVYVSHVCQHWRAVALACPELWTKLNFWERSYVEVVLSRCQTAPLSLKFPRFGEDSGEPERLLQMALAYIEQFRVVDLYWPSTPITGLPWYDALVEWIHAVPVLEEFRLNKHEPPFGHLPAAILWGGAPNLREMVVDNYHLSWPGALMGGSLTELVLRGNPFARSRPLRTEFLE